jgi:hypothetical protein
MKEVLLALLAAIEHLEANQAVIADRVGTGVTIADARDAKTAAMKQIRKSYAGLRKKIEALG